MKSMSSGEMVRPVEIGNESGPGRAPSKHSPCLYARAGKVATIERS